MSCTRIIYLRKVSKSHLPIRRQTYSNTPSRNETLLLTNRKLKTLSTNNAAGTTCALRYRQFPVTNSCRYNAYGTLSKSKGSTDKGAVTKRLESSQEHSVMSALNAWVWRQVGVPKGTLSFSRKSEQHDYRSRFASRNIHIFNHD